MKDRIKKIMESQHMTQQVFAEFTGVGAATLSGIFNDRTRPTLNVVEQIKKKIPDINTDWLMFGTGPMYLSSGTQAETPQPSPSTPPPTSGGRSAAATVQEPTLDFGQPFAAPARNAQPQPSNYNSVRNTRPEIIREEIKYIDKPQRRVTEIRVYYDDQTWESFVPSKK